jgi:hypothetical protein
VNKKQAKCALTIKYQELIEVFCASNAIPDWAGLKNTLMLSLTMLNEDHKMPLIKSSSKAAFRKNVAAEVKSGKPVAQSVAIAYSVKRNVQSKPAPKGKNG